MKTPHTITERWRKVRVELKDGTVFVDRFIERTSGKVCLFAKRGRVRCGVIKAMSDYRPSVFVSAHRK